MEKGQAFLAAGNFEKARIEFRNALQIVPTDGAARFENGAVDEKLGNVREAAQFYQGAIDANTDDVRARTALGRLYLFGGAPGKALETVEPALVKHPDDAGLLTVRAGAEIQQKNPDAALRDALRAVELAPSSEDAVSVLAGIYKSQNEPEKAQALLLDAIKRDPNTVDLRLVLAQLDSGLGRDAEVESLLQDLVRLRPEERAHRLRLAQFYSRTDKVDAAEAVLRDAIKALPDDRDLKIGLVGFLAQRRSREVADRELAGFVAANPKDYELKLLQGQYDENEKDYAKAESIYREIMADSKLEGPGIAARNRLAAMKIQLNEVPVAEKLIAEVLAASPRDNDALILRGNLALAQQDPRTAIADLRAVLRDQPNAVGVMRSLARAHLANGEPALAEETMRRAVEANPNDAGARLDLVKLLAQMGKPEQAKPIVDELVNQQPNDLQALEVQFKIAMATKDFVTAKSAADALLAASPNSGVGNYFLGELAEAEKRPDDARRYYTSALSVRPEAEEPLQAITRLDVNMKRVPEALKRLDDLATAFPKAPIAPNLKGEVLLASQRPAEAEQAFRTAIELEPQWWVPYRNLAIARFAGHDLNGAIAALQTGIEKTHGADVLEAELASLYERNGRPEDAIKVYESVLAKNPKADVAANNLAMLLVTYRKDPQSLDRAKQLAANFASSPNPDFLDTYGWVLYKRGEVDAAVTALQSAATKSPNAPVALYHLGMAQALAGQDEAARLSLSRSLESGTKFTGVDEAKAELQKLKPTPGTSAGRS